MPTENAHPLLTRDQCRAVDRYAIEQLKIPGIVLMENAGRGAADHIAQWTRQRSGRSEPPYGRVGIICGKGNNGGDGFVIARHLALRGFDVEVDLICEPEALQGDAATNVAIVLAMEIPVHPVSDKHQLNEAAERWKECHLLVDALLGTGFSGELRDPLASLVARINGVSGPLKVAIDTPSGFDVDAGVAGGAAVEADHTITMLAPKAGFNVSGAQRYIGQVTTVDIGAPLALILSRLESGTG